MKAILIGILMALFGGAASAAAEPGTPAGYVVELNLAGEDSASRAVIVRGGDEIAAKLMMPLYDKDVVFVRDPTSRVMLELGDGRSVMVGEGLGRYQVEGAIDTGDGTWSIIAAIGGVFAGEDDPAPENMVSKGGSLTVPMAVRGYNMLLRGHRRLWLGWSGGKAPYELSLVHGSSTVLVGNIAGSDTELTLPDDLPEKFAITVRDAEQQKVVLRFRLAQSLPDGTMWGNMQSTAGTLAVAAWLTTRNDGAWCIEAAQLLHAANKQAADVLLEKVRTGWKYSAAR